MRVVCSYCRKTIRDTPRSGACDVSHGMCPPCGEHFERLWGGMKLSEYLDTLGSPVLVVDGEGRVIAASREAARILGRERDELRGLLGGEALACVHSRLPEGCGRTVHCRECTIRRAVNQVAGTGRSLRRVPAYLDTDAGRVQLRIAVRDEGGLVHVVVEEMAPPGVPTARA